MEDGIGFGIIILLVFFAFFGLELLSVEKRRTEDEFEKGAAESTSMGGAILNAVNGMLNPGVKTGDNAVIEMKQGAHRKKRGDGKAKGDNKEENND